ncbi:mu-type opioid receptor isoform X2 [Entelurus aequoreus]|uniref:mu-type opioid receptor isoform X2 n=1 Tax=Entelurus aequoreus TaxID=161455 RepID=UPI002B1E0BD8|nr:mu-type opioid receptor isoform X2 [Entelurus aequoreus]
MARLHGSQMQSGSNSVLDLRLHFSWGLLAKQGECPPGVMERKVELEKEREERRTSVFFSASVPNTLRLHHLLIPPAPPPYPLALVHTLRLHHLLIPPAPPPHPACTTSLSPRTCPHTPPAPPPPSPRTSPQAPLSICTSLPGSRRSQAAEEHGERRQRLGWRRSQFDRRLDERQRRGRAVWQHERAGQRHGGALRGRASAERPPGRRGLQPGDDRHRHHGAVLHRVRGGAGGQRARHVHHRQVHQDEDGHQHLHLQPGAGRRPGHQHAALPERQLPDGHLALWGHPVQDGDVHRLLQHVHLHLHAHHHEHRPLRGRLPSRQGSGLQDAAQRQDRQRLQLDPVVRHRPARHLLGLHPCHALQHRGLQAAVSTAVLVLGHHAEDLRLHLRLHHARPHHHRLLRPHDPAPQERAHALRLAGEGQEPAAHHPHGAGGGGRLHRVLDAHPHLRHHHRPHQHPQLHPADHHLALLHRPGLHQQPQPCPLRLLGRELQALLPRVLLIQPVTDGLTHTHLLTGRSCGTPGATTPA